MCNHWKTNSIKKYYNVTIGQTEYAKGASPAVNSCCKAEFMQCVRETKLPLHLHDH